MSTLATVSIAEVRTAADPPSTRIEFEVRNEGSEAIWLVTDEWFVWHLAGRCIELSFQRTRMRDGAQVFGYFIPEVRRVGPSEAVQRTAVLSWPLPLSTIWNSLDEAAPDPGEYTVRLRIGYGSRPEPDPPGDDGDVEAPVFFWQNEVVSRPAAMTVPPYEREDRATPNPRDFGRGESDLPAGKPPPGSRP